MCYAKPATKRDMRDEMKIWVCDVCGRPCFLEAHGIDSEEPTTCPFPEDGGDVFEPVAEWDLQEDQSNEQPMPKLRKTKPDAR